MFERYTEKAKRSVYFARYEASQWGSWKIEVPHLLLGLVREIFPSFHRVKDIDRSVLVKAIEALCTKGPEAVPEDLDMPVSDACNRVFILAAGEAERLGHRRIGTEHLLLGVLLENGPETEILGKLGIGLDAAREKLMVPPPAI